MLFDLCKSTKIIPTISHLDDINQIAFILDPDDSTYTIEEIISVFDTLQQISPLYHWKNYSNSLHLDDINQITFIGPRLIRYQNWLSQLFKLKLL